MGRESQPKIEVPHFRQNDIMIIVTGLTGSGKSNFINNLPDCDNKHMAVGDTLTPCTTKIEYKILDPIQEFMPHLNLHARRLIIVDTPGFNNKGLTDTQILRDIVNWVDKSRVGEIAGVIYLYNISQDKFSSISKVDLTALHATFHKSEYVFRKIALVTTKWSILSETSEGVTRENELKDIHWNTLIRDGSQTMRFDDSPISAWEIVSAILARTGEDIFDIRKHLTELRKNLGDDKKGDNKKGILAKFQSFFGGWWGTADKKHAK
ncbi:hypothetical protein CPB84DRAFT_1789306 [Gymnopilus junonius]|uniref:G domain-containing protein n=1 Tax=Gymnopilus junonius TaxID=109634 RepID=A0A9P5NHN4_GYMJU|nr:hypothetical protein CPB84DRAFT_1789306 [Gymnopilus junonius]